MKGLLLFGGLFVLGYGIVILIAFRRPLFARIAIREATRRPWQSALVVASVVVLAISTPVQRSKSQSLVWA